MKVFVLYASYGEDPPETAIIGVFMSSARAEAEKLNCSLAHEDYWKKAGECDKRSQEIFWQWRNAFPKTVADASNGKIHAVYYDMMRILGYHAPKAFYREDVRSRSIQKLSEIISQFAGELPPLPEFPEPVPPPSRPIFSSYEMGIEEVDVEMAD